MIVLAICAALCVALLLSACDRDNHRDTPQPDLGKIIDDITDTGTDEDTAPPDDPENTGDVPSDGDNTQTLPSLGQVTSLVRQGNTFKYDWTAVEGAIGYQLTVSYLSRDGRVITLQKVLSADTLTYTITPNETIFPKGNLTYTVSVNAIADSKVNSDGQPKTTTVGITNGSFEWLPILISTTQDFLGIKNGMGYYYQLTCDLDFAGVRYAPIGSDVSSAVAFGGGLDGNGHTLKNITVSTELYQNDYYLYVGIFGAIKGATIKNLVIDHYVSRSPSNWFALRAIVGTLAGFVSDCTLENITTTDCVIDWTLYNNYGEPQLWMGGLTALAEGNYTVTRCVTDTAISGKVLNDATVIRESDGETLLTAKYAGRVIAGGLFAICGNLNYTHDGITAVQRPVERSGAKGSIDVKSYECIIGGLVGDCYPFEQLLSEGQENVTAFVDCFADMDIVADLEKADLSARTNSAYVRDIGLLIARCRYLTVTNCYSSSTIRLLYSDGNDVDDDYLDKSLPVVGFLTVTYWPTENTLDLNRTISSCYYVESSLVNIEAGNYGKVITATERNCGIRNHSRIVAVATSDTGSAAAYSGLDFDEVWQMTENGPALR